MTPEQRRRITELRAQRESAREQGVALLDRAEQENRDLNAEEREQYDRISEDIRSFGERIRRQEEMAETEDAEQRGRERLSLLDQDPAGAGERDREGRMRAPSWVEWRREQMLERDLVNPLLTAEGRRAFYAYMERGEQADHELRQQLRGAWTNSPEQRALSAVTPSAGGILVPTITMPELIQPLVQFGAIRRLARVIETETGAAIKWPVLSDRGAAAPTAENTAYPVSDIVISEIDLSAHKYARIIQVPRELVTDAVVDIPSLIGDLFGQTVGLAQDADYVNGNGTAVPRGFLLDAPVVAQSAGPDTTGVNTGLPIHGDDVVKLIYSVKPVYRALDAAFVANDNTILNLMLIKDQMGQYLWRSGLEAGQPDRLSGFPIYSDPFMPTATDGSGVTVPSAKSLAFGAWRYYIIRDVASIFFQTLVERFADLGQIGYVIDHRTDGHLTVAEAVKVLQQHA